MRVYHEVIYWRNGYDPGADDDAIDEDHGDVRREKCDSIVAAETLAGTLSDDSWNVRVHRVTRADVTNATVPMCPSAGFKPLTDAAAEARSEWVHHLLAMPEADLVLEVRQALIDAVDIAGQGTEAERRICQALRWIDEP